jgi:lipopolysaccharide/colanic/teichoic acid biosynthesis glycosyltransferase
MKRRPLHDWILTADLLWMLCAFASAQLFTRGLHSVDISSGEWFGLIPCLISSELIWALMSRLGNLDGFRNGWRFSAVVSRLLLAICFLSVAIAAISYCSARALPRHFLAYLGPLLWTGFLGIRAAALYLIRTRDWTVTHLAILGSGEVARRLVAKLQNHPELFCRVVGLVCPEADLAETSPELGITSHGPSVSTVDVANALQQEQIDEVIILQALNSIEVANLASRCRAAGIRVSLIPQPHEPYLSRLQLLYVDGLALLRPQDATASKAARTIKRAIDLILGALLAIVTLPVLAICALTLRYTTGRCFRWETRIGWRGREFSMLRLNIERNPQSGPFFQWLLWHLSISELPQLWNVFRGDMSLVGPRPEGPERTRHYSPWQEQRLSARPGITGLAQVQGLREQSSSEDKTEYDLQYLVRSSLFADLSLLLETVCVVAMRLLRFPRILLAHGRAPAPARGPIGNYPLQEELHAHRAQSGSD